jgi:phospholipid-binding lipoprotein MlaA
MFTIKKVINRTFQLLLIAALLTLPVYAQEDAWTYTTTDEHPGEQVTLSPQEYAEDRNPPKSLEDLDPMEPVNRWIFEFNEFFDFILFNPVGFVYRTILPEELRIRVGYILRNISEPIVFVNNLLQGNVEDARITLARLVVNSTIGIGGIFDVSSSLDLPYKREDFGLTLASWGVSPGPYIVLPILGPSTLRDTCGRIGDYAFDPVNWWAFFDDKAYYSYGRTALQIIDAKADSHQIMKELEKGTLDYYATIRAWYIERRKALARKELAGDNTETPHPDDED